MEAAAVNTWSAPSELALSEAFLAILAYEYRGFKLKIDIELVPLKMDSVRCIHIQWMTPSKLEMYKFIARSSNEFKVKSITLKLA